MKITDISADYNPFYDAEKANNGGAYWQYYGTCTVELDDGTTLSASYDNSSCGDFGERWYMEFIAEDGDNFHFCQNCIGTSDEDQADNDEMNVKTADLMFTRFGVYAPSLMYQVSYAINIAARDKYFSDSEDE